MDRTQILDASGTVRLRTDDLDARHELSESISGAMIPLSVLIQFKIVDDPLSGIQIFVAGGSNGFWKRGWWSHHFADVLAEMM